MVGLLSITVGDFLKNDFNRNHFVACIVVLCVIGFLILPAYATSATSVTLDRTDFYYNGHGAVVTVDHPDSAPNVPGVADSTTIIVKVCSNNTCTLVYYTCGSVTVTENPIDSRIFVSPVMKLLSSGATCPNLNGPGGKWIKAEYGITFSSIIPINAELDEDGCSAGSPPAATCQQLSSSTTSYFPKDANAVGFTQNFNTDTCAERAGLADNDFDGICDPWEDQSVHPGTLAIDFWEGGIEYTYTRTCGSPGSDFPDGCPGLGQKDIFVEIDALNQHMPSAATINAVRDAFLNSGQSIHLFYQLDEQIPFHKSTISKPSTGNAGNLLSTATDFDRIKAFHFGLAGERNNANTLYAKRQAFHYVLFTHLRTDSTTASGFAEMPGNDVMVSLGAFTQGTGSPSEQSAAFMHELGHNLGLDHGGAGDSINCKPNYLSVMSYSFEFTNYVANRPLDYSRSILPTLIENSLNEPLGTGNSSPSGLSTVYGPTTPLVKQTGTNFDWNRDGDGGQDNPANPWQDINALGVSDCPTSPTAETLNGKNDWNSLTYIFQNWASGQDGGGFPGDDTLDDDNDGVPNTRDNCPLAENPDQIDSDGDGVGDVCDEDYDNDNDGVPNATDNCLEVENLDQTDSDSDGIGDPCDTGGIDYNAEINNQIKFISVGEASQNNSQLTIDPVMNTTVDIPMDKGKSKSPMEQKSSDQKLTEGKELVPDQKTVDDLNVEISGTFYQGDNLKIYADFFYNKTIPAKHVNYDIVATQGNNTILKETHHETDGTGQDVIQGLESTSPVWVKVTVLGIGLPGQEKDWVVPKNKVVSSGIDGVTPEITYKDVMEIRHQTILYLKDLASGSSNKTVIIKPESTKNDIIKKLDEIAKNVKPNKILIDQETGLEIIDDHLGTAIQELDEVRQSITESQTDPDVKKILLLAVDDRIQAFAPAAEPANLPIPSPGKQVDFMWIVYIIIIISVGISVYVEETVRRRKREYRSSTPASRQKAD